MKTKMYIPKTDGETTNIVKTQVIKQTQGVQMSCASPSRIRQTQYFITQTSNASSGEMAYRTELPYNVNIFENINISLSVIDDISVKKSILLLLQSINRVLSRLNDIDNISNYLSKLHITKQEDSAALIEWNFQEFRIGFSIEPKPEESSYYVISEDKSKGSFSAETHRIGTDYDNVVKKIVDYAIRNT